MGKLGRKKGSQAKGYYFRTGRGWFVTGGGALKDEHGKPLKEKQTAARILQAAYARQLLGEESEPIPEDPTLFEVCEAYLDFCKMDSAPTTYHNRAGILFDFTTGLPAALRPLSEDELTARTQKPKQLTKAEREAMRIHRGYGNLRISQLKPVHIDRWVAAHPGWSGCRRTKIQAVKRALNYGVDSKITTYNPIKGYKVAKQRKRLTYLTPEQEKACYAHANPALAMAIRVCIRTGARYGCEFAKLTAKHITMTDKGMEWRFSPEESKTKKLRIIRIPKTEREARKVIAIVQKQMKLFPTGPIFRNRKGDPWKQSYLGHSFSKLRDKLKKHGIELDDDSCAYMLRHTYAKRTLAGYWTGRPCTIEALAALMGNTREVCWEHYAQWCDAYTDPLWESA